MDKATRKYLERYAEKINYTAILQSLSGHVFDHAIVVPCRAEGVGIQQLTTSIPHESQNILLILVINGREDDSEKVRQLNHESRAFLRNHFESRPVEDRGVDVYDSGFGTIISINCFEGEHCLSSREGVGLARKMGTDLALFLWTQDRIRSPYIQSTDADVQLPCDLLEQIYSIPRKPNFSALLLPFFHQPRPNTVEVSRASAIYEMSLRYYVMGLRYTGSPYAHHTIGSTILVHANDYAKVRGYPKRLAGEDFYILNKLRKLRPIHRCSGEPLQIQGRISRRVPFGTGRKIEEIRDHGECTFYSPQIFENLRQFLSLINELCYEPMRVADCFTNSKNVVIECLAELGYLNGIRTALRNEGTPHVRSERFLVYFDALKTLRTIHALRDRHFPNVDFQDALKHAPFLSNWTERPTNVEKAREALAELENSYFLVPPNNHL